VTGGDVRLKGHSRGITKGTLGSGNCNSVTMQCVYTVEHQFFFVTSLRSSTFVYCLPAEMISPARSFWARHHKSCLLSPPRFPFWNVTDRIWKKYWWGISSYQRAGGASRSAGGGNSRGTFVWY